ncbi:hypothetical protein B0H10DRAFT_2135386, partial [Mycena sp. CBHHK59/15]
TLHMPQMFLYDLCHLVLSSCCHLCTTLIFLSHYRTCTSTPSPPRRCLPPPPPRRSRQASSSSADFDARFDSHFHTHMRHVYGDFTGFTSNLPVLMLLAFRRNLTAHVLYRC